MAYLNEFATILGLIGMAVLAMWMLPSDAKDIVVAVVSGLLGYLAKGVHDGIKKEGKGQEVKADRPGKEG